MEVYTSIEVSPLPIQIKNCGSWDLFLFIDSNGNGMKILRPKFSDLHVNLNTHTHLLRPGRVEQLVGHLTRKSEVVGSIPGLATYFCFSFGCFKRGNYQLLAKVCARSTYVLINRLGGLSLPRKSVN